MVLGVLASETRLERVSGKIGDYDWLGTCLELCVVRVIMQ